MSDTTPTGSAPTLDGRQFAMVSSTASAVSADSPSVFRYHQSGAMIWGDYSGDTVLVGRFAGRRDGDSITIGFAHSPIDGSAPVLGTATSTIELDNDGRMLLIEDFDKAGVAHRSVCREVETTDDGELPSPAIDPLSLDATSFVLEVSSASTVDAVAPTRFDFSERTGVVWGEYRGDTVTTGHCVGVRTGSTLNEYFVHELVRTGETLMGDSSTEVRVRADGSLELVEEFVLDGTPGRSVCVQAADARASAG
jgi:hypothetical protein